jgi:arylformamidase
VSSCKQADCTLIDVSHSVEHGMITYKGLPAPIICDYLSRETSKKNYQKGTSFQIGSVTMASNTGTYVDVPFHRYEDGKDLSEFQLSRLANLEGIKIDISSSVKSIEVEHLEKFDLKSKAVLLNTGWSKHWRTEHYFENHPFVSEAAANYLLEQGALFVGIDSHNIDDTNGDTRPCHSILLANDIAICEHMTNLSELPVSGFKFFAVPVKMKGMGTFPVRAFGLIKSL